jgi:two-component system chemotaxis response regulator CheB
MEALQMGAFSVLLKPIGPASNEFQTRAKEVVQTVKAMAGVYVIRRRLRSRPTTGPTQFPGNVSEQRVQDQTSPRVLAIAASTGGPPALAKILSTLPADFPAPVLIVQHIADGFLDGFVRWLDSVVTVRVKVAEDHELLQAGTVYVAPQDHHLGVSRQRIRLSQSDPIAGFRPAGTYLFSTVAESFGNAAIGVILSGMGEDGVEGLKKIHAGGGFTIAQNEETCAVFGMPRAAIEAECVDLVLPLEKIGQRICDLVAVRRS